ncbi:hypothetical protein CVT26_012379 [Gymnopilus dilepis]|uniref:C2H2-type domain-containing protein n=1 Tax=Gymnopilus dilepis TaxID=231916 RepID=A0A409WAL4_9AGAR|nr:hypothetical protein CVT26_012379 [Gymnopilus dilepis]
MDTFGLNSHFEEPRYHESSARYQVNVPRDLQYEAFEGDATYAARIPLSPYYGQLEASARIYEPATHANQNFQVNYAPPSNSFAAAAYAQGGMRSSYPGGTVDYPPYPLRYGTQMRESSPFMVGGQQQWTYDAVNAQLQDHYYGNYASMPPTPPSASASDVNEFQTANTSKRCSTPHSTPYIDYDFEHPLQMTQRLLDFESSSALAGSIAATTSAPSDVKAMAIPPASHDDEVYTCLYNGCNRTFSSAHDASRHLSLPQPMGHGIRRGKNKSPPKDCLWFDCTERLQGSAFFRHVESHLEIGTPCSSCGKVFARAETLTSHIEVEHGGDAQPGPKCSRKRNARHEPY